MKIGDSIVTYGIWSTHKQSLSDGFIKGFCTSESNTSTFDVSVDVSVNTFWVGTSIKTKSARLVLTETTLKIFNGF